MEQKHDSGLILYIYILVSLFFTVENSFLFTRLYCILVKYYKTIIYLVCGEPGWLSLIFINNYYLGPSTVPVKHVYTHERAMSLHAHAQDGTRTPPLCTCSGRDSTHVALCV